MECISYWDEEKIFAKEATWFQSGLWFPLHNGGAQRYIFLTDFFERKGDHNHSHNPFLLSL